MPVKTIVGSGPALPRRAAASLVAAMAICASPGDAPASPHGPDFAVHDYSSRIEPVLAGEVDTDDFVSFLAEGERITARVVAGAGSALEPTLTLVDPSGAEVPVAVSYRRRGRVAGLRRFTAPESGRWTVRVGGRDLSEGDYVIRFQIEAARRERVAAESGGDTRVHMIQAAGGSLLSLRVTPGVTDSDVAVPCVLDPAGGEVPDLAAHSRRRGKRGGLVVERLPLTGGDGEYALHIETVAGTPYRVDWRVKRARLGRPVALKRGGSSGRGKPMPLSPAEPRIDRPDGPVDVVAGIPLTITGVNFTDSGLTSVTVGNSLATILSLTATACTVIVPVGPDGSTQSVTLVNPDGQADTSSAHVYFVPGATTSNSETYVPSFVGIEGGETVVVTGAGFAPSDEVLIDGAVAPTTFVDETRLSFVAPALPEGDHGVQLRDRFGRLTPAPALAAVLVGPPTLVPGDGFTAATPNPGTQGTGEGSDATAIARWNVVPFQEFTGTMTIGVVAFHMNGIDRVEFSAKAGPWTAVRELTRNVRTDTWEYQVALDAADFPDGLLEVRAVVYPTVGVPRVLAGNIGSEFREWNLLGGNHSMFLNADAGGTLPNPVRWVDSVNGSDATGDGAQSNPFATPYKAAQALGVCDGATINCAPGTYPWGPEAWPNPRTTTRWLTIQAAPGVDRSSVVFLGGSGFKTKLIRAHRLKMRSVFSTPQGGFRGLWLDGVECQGPGFSTTLTRAFHGSNWSGVWVTDSLVRDHSDGVRDVLLVRNTQLRDLTSDAFTDARMVLNCAVDGINSHGTDFHPDVYQFSGSGVRDNTIICGLKAVNVIAQGLFSDNVSNVNNTAIVNVLIAKDASATGFLMGQWSVPMNHLLMRGVTIARMNHAWRDKHQVGATYENIRIEGCVFQSMTNFEGVTAQDAWFRDCHFVDGNLTPGEGTTTGAASFVNAAANDFTPAPSSVLRGRLSSAMFPTDLDGATREVPDSVGAIR